jgi:hypothetical protein
MGPGRPRAASSAASSGPVHRDSGIPVAAGSWQASATTAARSAALIRRGRPDRGRSFSPSRRRAANRPRHLRAVSTLMPRPAAMRALARPRAAASTICARSRSRQQVLAPRTRIFRVLRSTAVSVTGTAAGSGIRRLPGRSPRRDSLPGHEMITSADARARHNGHVPAIPDSTRSSITLRLLDHAEKHWPQLERVQVRYRGAFAYVAGVLPGGEQIPLCRLRYGGSAHSFGFAIYSAAHDRYQDAVLVTGLPIGTPQEALDTACTVHLAGLGHEPDSRPPTNLRGHPLSNHLYEHHGRLEAGQIATVPCHLHRGLRRAGARAPVQRLEDDSALQRADTDRCAGSSFLKPTTRRSASIALTVAGPRATGPGILAWRRMSRPGRTHDVRPSRAGR